MLTADLVRARVQKGVVRPRYVDPGDEGLLAVAADLGGIFRAHVGRTQGELEETIADHIGDSTDFLVFRGLVKLVMDRATFEVASPVPPEDVRRAVFDESARSWPVAGAARVEVLRRAAHRLGLTPDEVERALYADLAAEARLAAVEAPEPRALLDRYNLALAQAVLLRAREVTLDLPDPRPARLRQVLRAVKFHRLMFRAERTPEGWRLVLDGPLSLFEKTSRYGLQLSLFLPALCRAPRFSLDADVLWGKERRALRFRVDEETGLVPTGRDTGTWEGEEERHLRRAFAKLETPWTLERSAEVIDLDGRGVLVPDYVLRHPDGRRAYLDIVWFWRKKTFVSRLALLREAAPPNLVVAVATRLHAGEGDVPDLASARVLPFKGVLPPARLVAMAEEVAS